MRNLTRAGKKLPVVRQTAVQLTQGLTQKDWVREIEKLHAFVRDRIRYVKDIRDVETLHTADRVLLNKQGDCDDKAILLASLLESLGHRTRFVAIGFKPNTYSHVYAEVFVNGRWVPLETTEPVEIGWQPSNVQAKMMVSNDGARPGLGSLAGKRVKKVLAQVAAQAAAAQAAAAQPGATEDQKAYAAAAQARHEGEQAAFAAKEATKPKGIVGKLKQVRLKVDPVARAQAYVKQVRKVGFKEATAQEKEKLKKEHLKATKLMAATGSPSFKKHAKFETGKFEAKELKTQIAQIQAQRQIADNPYLQEQEQIAYAKLNEIAQFQKKYIKQGKIAALIASIVIGFFTFGGGTGVVQSAFQALKQGAVDIAKKLLLGAIASGIAKGGSKKDAEEAQRAVDALSNYPPDPNLDSLDAMIEDSYAKQKEAQAKTLGWLIPVGLFVITAIT